jgi:hypothetical protein
MTRRALDGPVVADIAAKYTPGIAAMDAANAARALAGRARDADELREWLSLCGLVAGAWSAPSGAVAS